MYTAFFELNIAPFSLASEPHFLYLSERHREALAHLIYAVSEAPGFIVLTGEKGTGKTTLCHCLIEQVAHNVDIALLLNPHLTSIELLAALFDELHISYHRSNFTLKDFLDTFSAYLVTANAVGRRTVLIIDEAQKLTTELLEQVRLLADLEGPSNKLLQIILVGQPELSTQLKVRNLRKLAQRICAHYQLLPLSVKDTQNYINHRLAVSGAHSALFTKSSMRHIHQYSKGNPYLTNLVCHRALTHGFLTKQNPIGARLVKKVIQEVRREEEQKLTGASWAVIIIVMSFVIGVSWWRSTATSVQDHVIEDLPSQSMPFPIYTTTPISMEPLVVPIPPPISPDEAEMANFDPDNLTLAELLDSPYVEKDTDSAFTILFKQWGFNYAELEGKTACERAQTQKLMCLYTTGGWDEIRKYNQPVILELITKDRKQYSAVVTGLRDDVATVNFGKNSFEFQTSKIDEHWLGRFLLLWQPPTIPLPVLKQGVSHQSVVWIRKRLDLAEGKSSDPSTLIASFDRKLKERVVQFQRRQGLTADGVIGERTLIALSILSEQLPHLWQPSTAPVLKEEETKSSETTTRNEGTFVEDN